MIRRQMDKRVLEVSQDLRIRSQFVDIDEECMKFYVILSDIWKITTFKALRQEDFKALAR